MSFVCTEESKFLILREKYLELLENGKHVAAVEVLREELTEYFKDREVQEVQRKGKEGLGCDHRHYIGELHNLAALLMNQGNSDLYVKAKWLGR